MSAKAAHIPKRIKYPRRPVIRHSMRFIGRSFLPLLADVRISGSENFPRKGPLIVVGNHTAAMEVVLMTVYTPWLVEFMGSIDIPHEMFIGKIIAAYGFIPVFRGNVSPSSMKAGLDVLKQGGILGIFPEGGIWEPSIRRAQSGVAWLSYHARAPVLPVGFGAMQGALKEMFSFKRPKLKMKIGQIIPPVEKKTGMPQKALLQEAANRIMDTVWDLIPPENHSGELILKGERFELFVEVQNSEGNLVPIPNTLVPLHGAAFSKFIHRKTLINNFILNMNMPEVAVLTRLADTPNPPEIISATRSILHHLESDNPYYFTYRYGQREGSAMGESIREVRDLVVWACEQEHFLRLIPLRYYTSTETGEEIILERPEDFEKW